MKLHIPKNKVAAFVVETIDLTSLSPAFRPKKEKGKKTLADYGFTAQTVNENEAVIEAPGGVRRLAIKVLDQKSSGIYVCVAEPAENGGETKTQGVVLLKRKNPKALLKGASRFETLLHVRSLVEVTPRRTRTEAEQFRRNMVHPSRLWL